MKVTIKEGESQPTDCPNCEDKMGYAVTDYLKTHYTTYRNADGSFESGSYSDFQPVIHRGKTAVCANCNTKLPFWVERE